MTDFRQRQAVLTLTAPAAWGFTPSYLVQPANLMRYHQPREHFIMFPFIIMDTSQKCNRIFPEIP